jgi:hypothetical protein
MQHTRLIPKSPHPSCPAPCQRVRAGWTLAVAGAKRRCGCGSRGTCRTATRRPPALLHGCIMCIMPGFGCLQDVLWRVQLWQPGRSQMRLGEAVTHQRFCRGRCQGSSPWQAAPTPAAHARQACAWFMQHTRATVRQRRRARAVPVCICRPGVLSMPRQGLGLCSSQRQRLQSNQLSAAVAADVGCYWRAYGFRYLMQA